MKAVLLAVYVAVAWASPNPEGKPCARGAACVREFVVRRHDEGTPFFVSLNERWRPVLFWDGAVCERYRRRLAEAWIADLAVPFHRGELVSSRCGAWPDGEGGEPL